MPAKHCRYQPRRRWTRYCAASIANIGRLRTGLLCQREVWWRVLCANLYRQVSKQSKDAETITIVPLLSVRVTPLPPLSASQRNYYYCTSFIVPLPPLSASQLLSQTPVQACPSKPSPTTHGARRHDARRTLVDSRMHIHTYSRAHAHTHCYTHTCDFSRMSACVIGKPCCFLKTQSAGSHPYTIKGGSTLLAIPGTFVAALPVFSRILLLACDAVHAVLQHSIPGDPGEYSHPTVLISLGNTTATTKVVLRIPKS